TVAGKGDRLTATRTTHRMAIDPPPQHMRSLTTEAASENLPDMARCFTAWAGMVAVAVLVAAAPADDEKAVPPAPAVPAKLDLPPKNFTETVPGTEVKFEMVYVPAGEFLLGSPATEVGRTEDEGPQVRVKVRAFWLAKCECRWDEFDLWWKSEKLMAADEIPDNLKKADAITRPTNPYVDELYEGGRE